MKRISDPHAKFPNGKLIKRCSQARGLPARTAMSLA